MKEAAKEIETCSAKRYAGADGIYRFPFQVLDDTPGESNLGRIEWTVELIRGTRKAGRYNITKLLVSAHQTRDKRYTRKIFEIPCLSDGVMGHSLTREGSFTDHVWRVTFCEKHGGTVLSAYPENSHSVLEIRAGSLLSVDIFFRDARTR